MCDEWMPILRYRMTVDQYLHVPKHPAFNYEYEDGVTTLTPRANFVHAVLDFNDFRDRPVDEPAYPIRRCREADADGLLSCFRVSFPHAQPFASLPDDERDRASKACVERTLTGGDGPWIIQASRVAVHDEKILGGLLTTLLPIDPAKRDRGYMWLDQPPADAIARRLGQPHLTWIFVQWAEARHGLGTRMLASAVEELKDMGFERLYTTFMIGNDASLLWHWRRGFRLT